MLTHWSKFGSGNTYDVVEVHGVEEHGGTGCGFPLLLVAERLPTGVT
jgi:hypothetical protein